MRLSLAVLSATVIAGVSLSAQQQDFSQVQIKTTKIGPSFYTLEGQGGMIGALVGPDGVFLVDSQFAPLTDKIVAAVKQISDGRIKFLVNTHVHGDHTGGNENLGKLGSSSWRVRNCAHAWPSPRRPRTARPERRRRRRRSRSSPTPPRRSCT